MSGAAQGFAQGFQMMDAYYNRQDNRALRQDHLDLQNRRLDMAEERHQSNMEDAGLNRQLVQHSVDDLPASAEHRDKTRGLQLQEQELRVEDLRNKNAINDFELGASKTNAAKQALDSKNNNAAERYKAYAASQDWAGFVTDPAFKGTNIEPLQHAQGADAAIAISDAMGKGDIKTVIDQSNILFKSKLNRNVGKLKTEDGRTIQDITIIDFARQPDGKVKIPVRVTTDSGVYNSYISELRGIDPNDPDKVFTADDLYGTAAAMGQLATILKKSGVYDQLQGNADRYLSPRSGRGNGVPAEVQSVAMLSKMSGIPVKDLVEAKYFSQKDPSGSTMRKTALELAQKDPRWEEAQYMNDPAKGAAATQSLIKEYTSYLIGQGASETSANSAPQPSPAPDAAIQALREDPSLATEFRAKYNYLPEGFE